VTSYWRTTLFMAAAEAASLSYHDIAVRFVSF
jgi:hypothetical protein